MSETPQQGIPIYLDPVDRILVDSTAESATPQEWHPSNRAADRLLKCREALNDIQEVIESFSGVKNPTKRRRRLRPIFVPLHALCENLVALMDQIQSDRSIHGRLPPGATSTITKLKSRFVSLVPFDRKGKLGLLRNRVAAHYESSMSPADMRDLLNSTEVTEIGEWLHISIGVLCDLLKLDAFMWNASGPSADTITTMCQEPLISVLKVKDSAIVGFDGFLLCKKSPKMMLFEQIETVATISQCLFERSSDYRIHGFREDDPIDWARMLTPRDSAP
jgi:hypothetical protein